MRHILKDEYLDHVKRVPDEKLLMKIVEDQYKAKKLNDDVRYSKAYGVQPVVRDKNNDPFSWGKKDFMSTYDAPKKELPIKKYLVIIDDNLKSLGSYNSWLSMYSTWSRHCNITTIWVGQVL